MQKRDELTLGQWVGIGAETIVALVEAFKIRVLKKERRAEVLPLSTDVLEPGYSHELLLTVAARVNALVMLLLFWKPGRCFYRSYAIGSVLRKRGLPLELNFGLSMRTLESVKLKFSHCWLTLNGDAFLEKDDPHLSFPDKLGRSEGDVTYWVGKAGEKAEKAR